MKQKVIILLTIALIVTLNIADALPYCSLESPLIIAHHAGGKDWPENTVYAIKQDEKIGIKVINLTLELSKDNMLVSRNRH